MSIKFEIFENQIFAKLSLNLSFSKAELVFILDFFPTHPTTNQPTQPPTDWGKYQNDQIQLNLEKQSWLAWLVHLISPCDKFSLP